MVAAWRGEARAPDCPGGRSPARLRGPRRVALGKRRTPPGRRLGRDESGFFFFSQCVVRAWAAPSPRPGPRPARPEPAGVTQGRTPRARARARSPPAPGALCPRVPRPPPPFRPVAARRLRPLARRLSSAAAAPVTATPRLRVGPAPPPPPPLSPGAADNSPAFPGCLNGSGDVSTWSLGPAPVKSPSRQGLAASLSRRGCPAWSCVRHGSRLLLLLLPARPPALLPPPPPPAPRNLRPLAFPSPLPALPASPAPAPAVEKLGGEGRNAPPSASGAGEPGNRRRHLPTSPAEREGPESPRPPCPGPGFSPPRPPPRAAAAPLAGLLST